MLTRTSEHEPGIRPDWAVPAAMVCLAALAAFGLRFRFEGHIDDVESPVDVVAGPGLANADGDDSSRGDAGSRGDARAGDANAGASDSERRLDIDREPEPGIAAGRSESAVTDGRIGDDAGSDGRNIDGQGTDGQGSDGQGSDGQDSNGQGSDGQGSEGNTIASLESEGLWVSPESSGLPWSALGAVEGLLTFRGNPTRTYYGRGPLPRDPEVLWSATIGCSNSPVGGENKQWCGTGWTGQPSVFRNPAADDPENWWVGIGGYNRNVNFFDADNGDVVYPPLPTGDIIKGSITVDPDGFPLVYTGSRDNFFHIAAIDGPEPEELWRLSAADEDPTLWNNDWDSSAVIVDGFLLVGGENSRFYIVELNRGYDAAGKVTVDPEVVFSAAGWDQELLAEIGDQQVSIENSVAISGRTAYFTNSGGLVQGWDLGRLAEGRFPERVFRYWTGDDTDASVVVDDEGMLYVASEFERGNRRARELGQVFKLDPSRPDDPLVWSQEAATGIDGGVWATPAIHRDLLLVATDDGRVLGLDRADGSIRWTLDLPGPLWSSPVVVDGILIQGDCAGVLHAFDLSQGDRRPPELWQVDLGGCIESTPAVWDGRIFVGSRSGEFFAVGDAG